MRQFRRERKEKMNYPTLKVFGRTCVSYHFFASSTTQRMHARASKKQLNVLLRRFLRVNISENSQYYTCEQAT